MLTSLKFITSMELSSRLLTILIIAQCVLFTISSKVDHRQSLQIAQLIIDIIFTIDLFAKFNGKNRRYWKEPTNIFDAIVVITSLLGHFIVSNSQALTALRVIRLFRLFRILKLIPHFEQISNGLTQAIKASQGVFFMLLVLLSFFSILGFLLFSKSIPSHFSDPLLASYTVFSLFTVEGWNEIPSLVSEDSFDYYLVRAYVIAVIIFGSFFALSLANAIFIDEMVKDNNLELEKKIDDLTHQMNMQSKQIEDLQKLIIKANKHK